MSEEFTWQTISEPHHIIQAKMSPVPERSRKAIAEALDRASKRGLQKFLDRQLQRGAELDGAVGELRPSRAGEGRE